MMKKSIVVILSVLLLICTLTLCLRSCGDKKSIITSQSLLVNGTSITGRVSHSTEVFNFSQDITVSKKSSWILSFDLYGIQTVPTKTVPLVEGENRFYIHVTLRDKSVQTYTVVIYRNHMYTVSFDAAGGEPVHNQQVEEGQCAVAPTTSRTGYTFLSWDYNFENPIMENIVAHANWTPNSNTPYRVEHYLQNEENNGYTLTSTDDLAGTTDTIVYADIKSFDNFYHCNDHLSVMSGNVKADGSLVLRVYYDITTHALASEDIMKGKVTNSGLYKHGTTVTSTAMAYPGYEFVGWYDDRGFLLGTDETITTTANYSILARFTEHPDMANFNFTSTDTTCTITGIKNKYVSKIIVPDCVTDISKGAFYGCSSLESITLPFVGGSKSATSASASTVFGYIFGASSYNGGISTKQYYTPSVSTTYYIPSSLKSVTITGGNIFYGSFNNCANLITITLSDNITDIGDDAFRNCYRLVRVNIPNTVKSIGDMSFQGCESLTEVILPEGVNSIGANAFSGCIKLSGITIPNSVRSIGQKAFYDCTSLTHVTLPQGVVTIEKETFWNCVNLRSVVIPNSITSIEQNAFHCCCQLTSIVIPANVTEISEGAFSGCNKLAEVIDLSSLNIQPGVSEFHGGVGQFAIEVHQGTSKIVNQDGYLFYTYGGVNYLLGHISDETELVLPKNYKGQTYVISQYAFSECTKLVNIVIPDSVTSIGEGAFYRCSNLKSVVIDNGVTNIDRNAFYNCRNLTSIYYTGTESQWASIRKGDFWLDTSHYIAITYNYELSDMEYSEYASLNLAYTLSQDRTYYILSGVGNCKDTDIVIPAMYNGKPVKEIGNRAFYDCDNLTSVVIPNSVTNIGNAAFKDCNSLASVVIPESVTSIGNNAFECCYSLIGVVIPESVTSIGEYVFNWCISLTGVVIPESVTSIGRSAFSNCDSLTSMIIPDSVTSIGGFAFEGCHSLTSVVIGNGVTYIQYRTFYNCRNLTSVVIDNGFTGIDSKAFYGCPLQYNEYGNAYYLGTNEHPYQILVKSKNTSITSCIIHEDTKSILQGAFMDCTSLTAVYISDIAAWCNIKFNGFNPLPYAGNLYLNEILVTNLVIPDSVTSIGDAAFFGCDSLTSVVIPDSVTSIGDMAFSSCYNLTSIVIGNNVTSIGDYAFADCGNLTSIVIGNNVTSIGNEAFGGCYSLTSVVIPDSVTSIGDMAFADCGNLTSIVIGNNVTSIGEWVFYACTHLKSIYYRGTEEQWKAITKGTDWDLETGSYTITYNYTGE